MKIKRKYATTDYFMAYRKKKKNQYNRRITRKDFVVRADYGIIVAEYYAAISKTIIYDALSYYNSFKMGAVEIVKYELNLLDEKGELRRQALKVDWQATKDNWKVVYGKNTSVAELKLIKDKPLIYHTNDHSDGMSYRWLWDRRSATMKHQAKYMFKPVRKNSRLLASAIKNIKNIDFKEIDIKYGI